jgi:hypothetical protein
VEGVAGRVQADEALAAPDVVEEGKSAKLPQLEMLFGGTKKPGLPLRRTGLLEAELLGGLHWSWCWSWCAWAAGSSEDGSCGGDDEEFNGVHVVVWFVGCYATARLTHSASAD